MQSTKCPPRRRLTKEELQIRREEQAVQGNQAMREYRQAQTDVRIKTERLRALRLLKEANSLS